MNTMDFLGDILKDIMENKSTPLRKVIRGKLIKPQDDNCFMGTIEETKQDPITGEIISYQVEITSTMLGTGEIVNSHREIAGKCKACGSFGTRASIGQCARCGNTYCSKHLGMYQGFLVCSHCFKKLNTFWNGLTGHETAVLRGNHAKQQKLLGISDTESS